MLIDSKDFLHDKRIVARHLVQGYVKKDEYEADQAALPDLTDRAATTSIRVEPVTFRISVPGPKKIEEPRRPIDEDAES
jgi:hypothetical protein